MVTLIVSKESVSLRKRAKKVAEKFLSTSLDEMNFVRFDANYVLIQEIMTDVNYLPLGYDKKVVVIDNCPYFERTVKRKTKATNEVDFTSFYNFLDSSSEDVLLILTASSIDSNNELVKAIKDKGTIKEAPEVNPKDWKDGVYKYCKQNLKMNIDDDALNELTERTATDLANLISSCEKLMLYTDHITLDDVALLVNRPLEDKAYILFNHLINNDKTAALSLYRDLCVNNVEPIILISMLASQFRLLSQVNYLRSLNYNDNCIADFLNIKPGRVYVMKKNGERLKNKSIVKIIDELFNLDLNIKSGLVDRFYSFELFLLNF